MIRTSDGPAQSAGHAPPRGPGRILGRLTRRFRSVFDRVHLLPRALAFVNDDAIGRDYGIGRREKLRLLQHFARNIRAVENLCTVPEHLELAAAILRLPRAMPGDVVECGCYVGSVSVNLSLVCRMVGRRLIICDSFQGLPPPKDYDREHHAVHTGHTDRYWEGRFAASLDLVKDNLRRYGALEVCDFVVGFYDESLKSFDRPTALAFLDVDLIDSVKPCIEAIWPRMAQGSRMYVHEARNLPLVAVFYDNAYWREALGQDAPGFVGAGTGLPLSAHIGSEIGYAQKGLLPQAA